METTNLAGNLKERVSGISSIRVEPKEVTPIALTRELLAAWMLERKIMNNKHRENRAVTRPLIFTPPASSFVVVLSLNWLDGTDQAAVSPKTQGWNYLATRRRTAKDIAGGVEESSFTR
jgi:hypothetical protein